MNLSPLTPTKVGAQALFRNYIVYKQTGRLLHETGDLVKIVVDFQETHRKQKRPLAAQARAFIQAAREAGCSEDEAEIRENKSGLQA